MSVLNKDRPGEKKNSFFVDPGHTIFFWPQQSNNNNNNDNSDLQHKKNCKTSLVYINIKQKQVH